MREHGSNFTISNNTVHNNSNIGINISMIISKGNNPDKGAYRRECIIQQQSCRDRRRQDICGQGAPLSPSKTTFPVITPSVLSSVRNPARAGEQDTGYGNMTYNNISYNNLYANMALGAYANDGASVDSCFVENNVFFNTRSGSEITLTQDQRILSETTLLVTPWDRRRSAGSPAGSMRDIRLQLLVRFRQRRSLRNGRPEYSGLQALRTATGQEAHSISGNPGFLNLAQYDFHLAAGSPA